MQKLSEKEAQQFSPLTLAFLGDSVYELMIRIMNPLNKTINPMFVKIHDNTFYSYIFKHFNIWEIVNH